MIGSNEFVQLASQQASHDDKAHGDVAVTEITTRMAHYVAHFTKYTASLEAAMKARTRPDDEALKRLIAQDTFLIALAYANIIDKNLLERMLNDFEKPEDFSVKSYVSSLRLTTNWQDLTDETVLECYISNFVTAAGELARVVDHSFHNENLLRDVHENLREKAIENLRRMLNGCIIYAHMMGWNITAEANSWRAYIQDNQIA